MASVTQLIECRFHIEGIPQHYRIDDQAQCPELILLAFTIPLPEFATLPMKDRTRYTVGAFSSIELGGSSSLSSPVSVMSMSKGPIPLCMMPSVFATPPENDQVVSSFWS